MLQINKAALEAANNSPAVKAKSNELRGGGQKDKSIEIACLVNGHVLAKAPVTLPAGNFVMATGRALVDTFKEFKEAAGQKPSALYQVGTKGEPVRQWSNEPQAALAARIQKALGIEVGEGKYLKEENKKFLEQAMAWPGAAELVEEAEALGK